ncbi:MAG: WbqC family protein [Verrucomicrobiota bacterium]
MLSPEASQPSKLNCSESVGSVAATALAQRVVSIHQPHYLPWLGLLAKIAASDIFIWLDTVQYNRWDFQHRTRYSTEHGLKYLSLSVCSKGTQTNRVLIKDVLLADKQILPKHFQTLRHRYGKTPGWKHVKERLAYIYHHPFERMDEVCWATTRLSLDLFHLKPVVHIASQLPVVGVKSELMLNLTRAVGGDHYLSGPGARTYLDMAIFAQAGTGVSFHEFKHPIWKQTSGHPFHAAAFAMEWFLEEPEEAVAGFQQLLRSNLNHPSRCFQY